MTYIGEFAEIAVLTGRQFKYCRHPMEVVSRRSADDVERALPRPTKRTDLLDIEFYFGFSAIICETIVEYATLTLRKRRNVTNGGKKCNHLSQDTSANSLKSEA